MNSTRALGIIAIVWSRYTRNWAQDNGMVLFCKTAHITILRRPVVWRLISQLGGVLG